MATPTTLHELLGLPTEQDVDTARERIRAHFGEVADAVRRADQQWNDLGNRTGLPTYHDVFAGTQALREWVAEQFPQDGESDEDTSGEEGDSLWPWVVAAAMAAGAAVTYVWGLLDHEVSTSEDITIVEIDGFEIDGIPWTFERLHLPGLPYAARVGDPMLHGGTALPGPGAGLGSGNVLIGGLGALTVEHVVAACPLTNVVGVPHIPQPGSWRTTNGSVYVNGKPLLRNGDWLLETPGGCNPLTSGAPTVVAGPPARPCMVDEVEYVALIDLVPGLERFGWEGGTIVFTGSFSWNVQDMLGVTAAGVVAYYGPAMPVLGPLAPWAARAIMGAMDGPSIGVGLKFKTGQLFAELWGGRHRWDPPDFDAGRSAEVDPADPSRAKKQKEKREWKKDKK